MKVTLIKVSMMDGKGYDAMKPLIFAIFDAITPRDIEIEYIDERIEPLPEIINSDIIALSVETFAARRAYNIATKYKTENNHIVMGGFHPSAVPEEALEYCDTVLIGDAEDTWLEFLNDYKNGTAKSTYTSSLKESLIPINFNSPAFKGKKYNKIGLVQFSRGCKFKCDFCSVSSFYHCKVRQKRIDEIVSEIENIREKILFFIDDNIFLNEKSATELFNAIKPLNKKWACQISMDIAQNNRLLSIMKESGCVLVLIGFETLNTENLTLMNKTANINIKTYEKAIQNINRHGIMIWATFVHGYDNDDAASINSTMQFAIKNNLAVANFNPLIPMPDTPLYKRLESNNKLIFKKWWLEKDYRYGDTVFYPEKMTPEELKQGCKNARFIFNSYKSIIKRLLGAKVNRKNALLFLAINIISRKEIHRKQGKIIGGKDK
ncbi:MAG: B12-binding domain-containing radical SAM protein [Ruminococcaceae bacterium]|nr:B12-binding domain-containing radical SAM protein [Oscillospiraceae bacterium]